MENLLQDITIYHKNGTTYDRYNLKASLRNTAYRNRNMNGVMDADRALIRVFDSKGYNFTWKCEKGDIIVSSDVYDTILKAPLTELREKYGKDSVYEVTSIDKFDFQDNDLQEINHIKIGAK